MEKLMIDRILFHIHSNDLLNDNQYRFIPQKGTVDAAMEVKTFIEESLRLKQCAVIALTLRGHLMQSGGPASCPKNLYNLSASYFNNRKASLSANNYRTEKEVQKG
ncbi:MAG: hypothetical protein FWE02_07945 [Defluviitaleaceae bacterium]|nr:hypothetical protein [Defluviitaleaceae bacterium]